MSANSSARGSASSAKALTRPHARLTACLGTGLIVSAIAVLARSSSVSHSEALRSIAPNVTESLRLARAAVAAIDVEDAIRLIGLMLGGVLATVLGGGSLPRLVEATTYVGCLAAATKRSAAGAIPRRLGANGTDPGMKPVQDPRRAGRISP